MLNVLTLVGGTLAVGAYKYWAQESISAQAHSPAQNVRGIGGLSTDDIVAGDQSRQSAANQYNVHATELRRGVQAASVSLGLAATGLLFPPLHLAAVPTLIYMGIPSAQQAYSQLRHDHRAGRALAETAALAGCLAGGFYLVGSLGFSLYYLGRSTLHHRRGAGQPQPHVGWQRPQTVTVRQASGDVTLLWHELQLGDCVHLRSGDVVPVDGFIVDGSGLVKPSGLADAAEQMKQPGDCVAAMDVVTLGAICIKVQRTD